MITKELQAIVDKIEQAKDEAEKAILARAVEIAERMGLDEVMWGCYKNYYMRDGKDVESKQLDELERLYCDNIHDGGIVCCWTRGKGWE